MQNLYTAMSQLFDPSSYLQATDTFKRTDMYDVLQFQWYPYKLKPFQACSQNPAKMLLWLQ